MRNLVTWKIASPMIFLGAVLMLLGMMAAWNVSSQQAANSDFISREVSGVITVEELHLVMREIRYQVNIFLRTKNPGALRIVQESHPEADTRLRSAKKLARPGKETELIDRVTRGYDTFFQEFQRINSELNIENADGPVQVDADVSESLAHLSDVVLTTEVLEPLREYIYFNEQVVQRTEAASRSTAQQMKVGFLLLGLCGGAAGALLGLAIAKSIGRSMVQLNVSVRGMMDQLAHLTGPVEFSHRGNLKSIEYVLKKVEDDIAAVVADWQKREVELLRSEQLAQVGKLAAGLAHELRNPLMPIKMLVQVAMQKSDGNGLRGHALQIISDEITRMENSIDTFLDFAKPPKPEVRNHNFVSIIENVIKLVSARLSIQQADLQFSYPSHPVLAQVDRSQMTQLVLNLLLNALDAMHAPGIVQVKLEERDNELELSIIDSGPGIPDEMLQKIFDPFITSKPDGVGLGLSICKRVAEAHGGSVHASNEKGLGARFVLLLPTSLSAEVPKIEGKIELSQSGV